MYGRRLARIAFGAVLLLGVVGLLARIGPLALGGQGDGFDQWAMLSRDLTAPAHLVPALAAMETLVARELAVLGGHLPAATARSS